MKRNILFLFIVTVFMATGCDRRSTDEERAAAHFAHLEKTQAEYFATHPTTSDQRISEFRASDRFRENVHDDFNGVNAYTQYIQAGGKYDLGYRRLFGGENNRHPDRKNMTDEHSEIISKARRDIYSWSNATARDIDRIWSQVPEDDRSHAVLDELLMPYYKKYDEAVLERLEAFKDFYVPPFESIAVTRQKEGYWEKHPVDMEIVKAIRNISPIGVVPPMPEPQHAE